MQSALCTGLETVTGNLQTDGPWTDPWVLFGPKFSTWTMAVDHGYFLSSMGILRIAKSQTIVGVVVSYHLDFFSVNPVPSL